MSFSILTDNCFSLNGFILCYHEFKRVAIYNELGIVRIIFNDYMIKDFIVTDVTLVLLKKYLSNLSDSSFEFIIK